MDERESQPAKRYCRGEGQVVKTDRDEARRGPAFQLEPVDEICGGKAKGHADSVGNVLECDSGVFEGDDVGLVAVLGFGLCEVVNI